MDQLLETTQPADAPPAGPERRHSESNDLLSAARLHLDWLARCCEGVPHRASLTDSAGIALWTGGSEDGEAEFTNHAPVHDGLGAVVGGIELRTTAEGAKYLPLVAGVAFAIERELASRAEIRRLKQENLQLQADLARFRTLIENSGEGVTLIAADGTVLFTSPATHRLWGYAEDEVVGKSGFEFVHPDDIEPTLAVLARLLAEPGSQATAEYRLRHKDGRWRWMDSRGVNLLHEPAVQAVVVVYRDVTDRKDAERSLQESQQRFARFMQHLPGLAWIKDVEGRYVYVNEAAERIFDQAREGLYGKTDLDLFPAETANLFRENDRRALASEAGIQEIESLQHDDGLMHHSVVSKFPIPGPNGQAVLIGGMAIDVTERLQAEETVHALLRISERLNSTLDADELLDILVHEALVLVNAEAGWAGLYTPHGMACRIYHRREHTQPVEHCFAPQQGLPGWLIVHKRPYLANDAAADPQFGQELREQYGVRSALSIPILSAQNEVLGFFEMHNKRGGGFTTADEARLVAVSQTAAVAIQNALAYRRLERIQEALREGELRYRLVAQAANDAIWDWDLTTNDVTWNESIQKLFGYPIEQIGLDAGWWHDNIHEEDQQRVIEELQRAIGQDTEVWHAEYRFRRGDGTYAEVLDRGRVVRDAGGKPVRMVGSIMDLSERKRAEIALREADRRKDEFLATLAHELRNPLAPVRSSIAVLKAKMPPDPDLDWARGVIDRQVAQMARLLDDLLDVSRITRNKLELRKERVELAAVVQIALETSRPLIEAAGHHLAVSLPPEPVLLNADPVRLAQVFSNLLNNAAKYTDDAGHIWLTADRIGDEVVVSVRDTGIGIPPEQLPKLFEMFSQVSSSLERSQGGLGIGLSLVRGLVELHGGRVAAQSDGTGRGSQFSVYLPALGASVAGSDKPAAGDPLRRRPSSGIKILVADDNRDAANMLALMLRIGGHDVQTAHDGLEAIHTAAACRPDAVLLDIGMPRLNGYEAARRVRAEAWGQNVLLIALTGWGQEEDKRRAAEAGFDHHLTKPIDPEELLALLSAEARRRNS